MVPGSFGCGSADFAAITTLAPSRAARTPMASPMPRDAPVMNSVLSLSDIAAASACQRQRRVLHEGGAGDHRLLHPLCANRDIFGEEAGERDAGRVSRIGVTALPGRVGGERR